MFGLISIAVTCLLLHSVHAANFECNDEPTACKTKFANQFEKDFKELHLTAMRKLMTTYIDKTNSIKSQLSAGDPYIKSTEESINAVKKTLQKLNDNVNDNKKIAEAYVEAMNGMSWDWQDTPESENFKNLIESQNVRQSLVDVLRQIGLDVGNLWAEMYSGLREEDLKAYPEYAEVNGFMETLRGNGERPARALHFTKAAQVLDQKFNIPYFAFITDIN